MFIDMKYTFVHISVTFLHRLHLHLTLVINNNESFVSTAMLLLTCG